MKKREFLMKLQNKLSGLPQDEVKERLNFYSEMIDGRMDDGLSEQDAVAQIGTVDEIATQILAEMPLTRLIKEKMKPNRRFKTWEIVLLAVGSPIWLSLLISAFAVVISLYVSLWAVVVSAWAMFASAAACALGGVAGSMIIVMSGHTLPGVAMLGCGIFSAGLSIFLFCGCKAATKGTVWLTQKTVLGIKCCFVKKEGE